MCKEYHTYNHTYTKQNYKPLNVLDISNNGYWIRYGLGHY